MSGLSNQEILSATVQLINARATAIANEEMELYLKENQNALIDGEIRGIINQRVNSELMLRMSNFKPGTETADQDALTDHFNRWFADGEEEHLRNMCHSCIAEELKKHTLPDEENLSFTEKFQRAVRERAKSGNTANLMKDLFE